MAPTEEELEEMQVLGYILGGLRLQKVRATDATVKPAPPPAPEPSPEPTTSALNSVVAASAGAGMSHDGEAGKGPLEGKGGRLEFMTEAALLSAFNNNSGGGGGMVMSADADPAVREAQIEELQVLESIYGDDCHVDYGSWTCQVRVRLADDAVQSSADVFGAAGGHPSGAVSPPGWFHDPHEQSILFLAALPPGYPSQGVPAMRLVPHESLRMAREMATGGTTVGAVGEGLVGRSGGHADTSGAHAGLCGWALAELDEMARASGGEPCLYQCIEWLKQQDVLWEISASQPLANGKGPGAARGGADASRRGAELYSGSYHANGPMAQGPDGAVWVEPSAIGHVASLDDEAFERLLKAGRFAQEAQSRKDSGASARVNGSAAAGAAGGGAEASLGIVHGEPFVERKSKFQAHLAPVTSMDQVTRVMDELLSDKRIAEATHNIMAYRYCVEETGVVAQDSDDDGEAAAGGRLLHLLQVVDARNVVVVVSRWFGGVLLGPDRFKFINNAARELLDAQGFIAAKGKEDRRGAGHKPKGKGRK
eukprot:jgi/Mesvir1/27846/Mv07521-RA.1